MKQDAVVRIERKVLAVGHDTIISPIFVSACGYSMSLFGAISSLASIPFQFSADCRFVNSDRLGNLRLIVVTFQKGMYLISLALGSRRRAELAGYSS